MPPFSCTDKIQIIREIGSFRLKADATRDPTSGLWECRAMDQLGDLTCDCASSSDPMEVWGVLAELLDAAEKASRTALRELAGVA